MRKMKYRKWNLKYKYPTVSPELSSENLPELLKLLLAERGFSSREEVRRFLGSGIESLHDPFLLKDMDKACERLQLGLKNGEKIAVYGDYDVDGITSTCIVSQWLKKKGVSVVPYIPNRLEEGYGLNREAMDTLHEKGVSLIITVDCGVTAVEEVAHARELGMDVIITIIMSASPALSRTRPPLSIPCGRMTRIPTRTLRESASPGSCCPLWTEILCRRSGLTLITLRSEPLPM